MSNSDELDAIVQTPAEVADEMVRRLFPDGHPHPDDRILFPGIGHGDLVDAVDRYCDRHNLEFPESVALETNEELVERTRSRFESHPLDVYHLDFLGDLPEFGKFDYVVSDPPVRRLTDISPVQREDLAMRFDTISADESGHDEDLYVAFFEQGLRMLAPEGRLVFVTPDFTSQPGQYAIPELKRRLTTFHIEDIEESPIESPYEDVDLDIVITTVAHVEPDPDFAADVDFKGVQEALTTSYDIGVSDIMTQDPASFYPDDDVHDVYVSLVRNDYDAAPVRNRDSEDCIGLVSKADLTGADIGTLEDGYIEDIEENRLLQNTASFQETLDRLRSLRYCLVESDGNVQGIVTRFDLNSIEVYFHLYAKFARFEIGLRNAIRDYDVDWEDALLDAGVDWDRIKDLGKRHSDNSEVERDVLDTLLLSDLIKIAENSVVSEEVGIRRSGVEATLPAINDLRGSVAHYQPLIHTMDTMSFTRRRTTGDFGDIYDALNGHLSQLEEGRHV